MHRDFVAHFLQAGAIISLGEKQVAVGWDRDPRPSPSSQAPFSSDFPDFFLRNQTPWLVCEFNRVMDEAELHAAVPPVDPPSKMNWSPADKRLFLRQCSAFQERVERGLLLKAVPFACESAQKTGFSAAHRHAALSSGLQRIARAPLFLYGFWNASEGIMGVTPEPLFRQELKEGQWQISTCAMAGTVKRDEGDWKEEKKLLKEHEIVVRDIVESLAFLWLCRSLANLSHALCSIFSSHHQARGASRGSCSVSGAGRAPSPHASFGCLSQRGGEGLAARGSGMARPGALWGSCGCEKGERKRVVSGRHSQYSMAGEHGHSLRRMWSG